MQQKVVFRDLGKMKYKEAWDLQESMLQENADTKVACRKNGELTPDQIPTSHTLLFVEHPPCTLWARAERKNIY